MTDPLNNSYYRATANQWENCAPYAGGENFDVAVIGGGFTGLSAALACAEKGLRVGLFEAETIGHGASGRNGGQLIPGLRWSMREIDEEFGRERAQAIFDLAYGAVGAVRSRIADHAIDCDLKAGHLEAAYKPAHFDAMRRDTDFLAAQFGWTADIVTPQDLPRHIMDGGYHGGIYDPNGGHFHPLNYALGLAQACLVAGVKIFERSRVTPDELSATSMILATDCWTGEVNRDLGGFTVPIINYNIATAPLTNADTLLPSDAAVADSRFVLNYFRLSADKRLIFGGGEKYVQRPPADIADFVRRHMVSVFQSLAATPIDYAWGGAVGVTMNRLPHLGRKGNIFFAHGFSGHGALVTTLAGELLADAVVGTMERFDVFHIYRTSVFRGGGGWLGRSQPLACCGTPCEIGYDQSH
jgi:gamma-glutamylputrescine oxidase